MMPKVDPLATAGRLVVIVGPSGAGKDSVIGHAMRALDRDPRFGLVRRVITRPSGAGGEDHEAAGAQAFDAMAEAGRFAVHWQAHGLSYGIPADVRTALAGGKNMLVNGSRQALPHFRAAFPRLVVVLVTAPDDVLARRLASRGRESEADILARLHRKPVEPDIAPDLVIDNGGPLAVAGDRLVALLRQMAADADGKADMAASAV